MKANKTISLLLILLILSVVFLGVLALASQYVNNQAANTGVPVKEVQERAFTNLTASSSKNEIAVGETFPITVSIDTGDNLVTIVQLALSYDPTLLTIESVSQGDFFVTPIEYAKKIDKELGEIQYAIGSFEGKKGQGTLATIRVTAKKKTQANAPVEVLTIKSTSIVAELGSEQSVLKARKGASVVVR